MVVRQTSVVWLILIGLGCIDLELQSQLLSATECQHDSLSSWVQIKVNLLFLSPSLIKNIFQN